MSMTMAVYGQLLGMLGSAIASFFHSLDAAVIISSPQLTILDMLIAFEVIELLFDFYNLIIEDEDD